MHEVQYMCSSGILNGIENVPWVKGFSRTLSHADAGLGRVE